MRRIVTPREEQVLAELRRGEPNKSIARSLGISEQAVKAHVSRLFLKFGVVNRAGLATAAAERDGRVVAREAATANGDLDDANLALARTNSRLVTENERLREENAILRDAQEAALS